MCRFVIGLVVLFVSSSSLFSLEPNQVFLVVNKNEPKSRIVADYYCQLRRVPATNVIELDLPIFEEITRAEYETKLLTPLRTALRSRQQQVKVLLTIYGVPLRVGPQLPTEQEQQQLVGARADLTAKQKDAEVRTATAKSLEEDAKKLNLPTLQERVDKIRKEVAEMQKQIQELEATVRRLNHDESTAALDSELMLLWWGQYPKERWVLNPMYWQMPEGIRRRFPPTVMTCRIDGPTLNVAKSLVSDAVWAEEHGLKGKAYIDARGIPYDPNQDVTGTGYGGYDESMREAAKLLKDQAQLDVQLDNAEPLFERDSCTECAIYCGWYSVRNYVPCCKFNRGAIAWHLASFEMESLRWPRTQWCGNLLIDGACATLGPVAEPYTVAFPKPEEFFGFVASGEYTLVESYSRSLLLTSWMMCLVGDPLYNPYRSVAKTRKIDVAPSPKGSKYLIGS